VALTYPQQLQALYAAPGVLSQVAVYIRADIVATLTGTLDVGTGKMVGGNFSPASFISELRSGDILQIENEDMLITALSGPDIIIRRGYADTTEVAHSAFITVWRWVDFTDRIGMQHGIESVSSLRRSFEKSIDKFETSSGRLRAMNLDRFWDKVTPPPGFSSYRHKWVRFYIKTMRGGVLTHVRALSTMLLSDIKTDDSPTAELSLIGIGSLLRAPTESESLKLGREHYAYTPTSMIVEGLLSSIDEFRVPAEQDFTGIPTHWRDTLRQRAARTISLPSGTFAVSHFGKPAAFIKQNGGFAHPWLDRNLSTLSSGVAGNYPSAMVYDPQVVGVGNVFTGDTARAGRLFLGIGSSIYEFDPITLESTLRFFNATGGQRIRRLWYNALDTTTAGKPKICGLAWSDYPLVLSNNTWSARSVGATLFRWNGASGILDRSQVVNTLWPGTHVMRKGDATGLGGNTVDDAAQGENIALPFPQKLGWPTGSGLGTTYLVGGIRQYLKSAPPAGEPGSNGFRLRDQSGGSQEPYDIGIVYEAVTDSERGTPAALNKSYWAIAFANTVSAEGGHNVKYALGQMGAAAYVGDPLGITAWATGGAIVYCDLNTTNGVPTIKTWNVMDGTGSTLQTLTAGDQPISMCGNDGAWATGPVGAYGFIRWSETGDSQSFIESFTMGAIISVWDGTDVGSYLTPIWMKLLAGTGSTKRTLITTFFSRNNVGLSDMFHMRGFLADTLYSGITMDVAIASIPHAFTAVPGQTRQAFALDSAGRLMKFEVKDSDGKIDTTATQVLDRGFAPVDGEHWSATLELAALTANKVYGISSPTWPFGDDIRGDVHDGMYIAWKYDSDLMDNTELAYFKDKTLEEAMGDLAFAGAAVWGFDNDGRGNFLFDDRIKTGAGIVRFGGGTDLSTRLSKRRGYEEVENQVEITPYTFRSGTITADIDLTSESTLKASPELLEVQAPDPKEKLVSLKCIQGGRVGTARFSYYLQGGTLKGWLSNTYAGGVATGVVFVSGGGKSLGGPHNELDASGDLQRELQIPKNSVIRLPDGTERTITNISGASTGFLTLSLSSNWTPASTVYAGSPVEIDLEVDRSYAGSTSAAAGDGKDVLVSSFEWQELGAGKDWRSGILIRFSEPPDDGYDINYNESSWHEGDRITIKIPGIEVVANDNAKVTAFDADAIRKYGKRVFSTQRGNLLARKALYIGQSRLTQNKQPRWIWSIDTALAPYVSLWDRVEVYSPDLVPTDPHVETVTVRAITHDIARARSVIEAIGAVHD